MLPECAVVEGNGSLLRLVSTYAPDSYVSSRQTANWNVFPTTYNSSRAILVRPGTPHEAQEGEEAHGQASPHALLQEHLGRLVLEYRVYLGIRGYILCTGLRKTQLEK